MTDYTELVKALRCKDHPCDGCKYKMTIDLEDNCFTCDDGQLMDDAAAAIEALQAQLPKRGEWKTTEAFPHRVYCSNCFRTYVPNDRWQIWVDKPGEGGLERNYCPSCGAKMEVQDGQ